jgi:enterochelin esterase-like enzyme
MKKISLAILLLLAFFASTVFAQTGKVNDNVTLTSKILKGKRKFAIYLPPDYDLSQRSYPVLYLLHGAGDDQTGWVQFGEVQHITNKAIIDGIATPMIIVMPDANTGQRGYFNSPDGKWRYEDFFFQELVPYIEKNYRTKTEKRYRAIAGLSMGGGGTLMYAMHHPDKFSAACPLSAYIGPLSLAEARTHWGANTSDISDSTLNVYYQQHNALSLVQQINDKEAVRWYIDCGDDDFLYEGNCLLHMSLRKREIAHEFRVRDGAHNWTYWRQALPEVLRFVSMSFQQY